VKSNLPSRDRQKRLSSLVCLRPTFDEAFTHFRISPCTGEAGKVEESMAKLEAVEALRSEKAEKEVRRHS
jgi:hypothetical protein